MLCIKKRDEQTDGRTNNPEAICPSNFFEVGGIKTKIRAQHNLIPSHWIVDEFRFNDTSTYEGHLHLPVFIGH